MSLSALKPKKTGFLLDENIKKELLDFLVSEKCDVAFKPKELSKYL